MYNRPVELERSIELLREKLEKLQRDSSMSVEEKTRQMSLLQHKIECRQTRIDMKAGYKPRFLDAVTGGSINLID